MELVAIIISAFMLLVTILGGLAKVLQQHFVTREHMFKKIAEISTVQAQALSSLELRIERDFQRKKKE